jgi:antitoxin CptB
MGLFHLEPVAAQGRLGQDTSAMTSTPDITLRRKRLLWRATHRGIKEMDLILGGFVAANLEGLSADDIADLERIMDIPDQDMLTWATKQAPIPPEHASPLLGRILACAP